jgi:hypothetical protein
MKFVRNGAKAAVLVLGAIVLPVAVAVGAYFGGKWLWGELAAYIRPGDATERKDLVNIIVLIGAGIVGALTALCALLNAYFTRRNLQNAREAMRQQRELEDRQHELEEQRSQEDALQSYFEQMGDLLAICRWASIIRLRSVVPDLGHPIMNTYGFTPASPSVAVSPRRRRLGQTTHGSVPPKPASPLAGADRLEDSRAPRGDLRQPPRSPRRLSRASLCASSSAWT